MEVNLKNQPHSKEKEQNEKILSCTRKKQKSSHFLLILDEHGKKYLNYNGKIFRNKTCVYYLLK